MSDQVQLVFAFGGTSVLRHTAHLEEIRSAFPNARLVGCSTGGEIMGDRVFDESLAVTGVAFENSTLQCAETTLDGIADSFDAGARLAGALAPDNLVHVLVLSAGLNVNGSALAEGLHSRLPAHVAVTGGLAADSVHFRETLVFLDSVSDRNTVAAIGFYGDALQIGYGSRGGWDSFGPDRLVTRAKANVLYELDGQSVLDLYRKYLGDQAKGLPATGLFFPLSLRIEGSDQRLVRTIQAINEEDGSATFTGDIPEDCYARLMKGNSERLLEGAAESARQAQVAGSPAPHLAIVISCVGRKLVLKQRIDEEVESVRSILGPDTTIAGFYSHGEICPLDAKDKHAKLHNQTMTVTTISERQN
jgi:hypothetical protein